MLGIVFAYAQTASIMSADSSGAEKNQFDITEDVFVEGACRAADDNIVRIYVVPDRPHWSGGELLIDVRGTPTIAQVDFQGKIIGSKLLWAGPLIVGDYDIVIDTDGNSTNNPWENCIDDMAPIGFKVVTPSSAQPPIGSGDVSRGPNDPGDHGWIFGPGDPNNVMLYITLSVDQTEDVDVSIFKLQGSGSGDESVSITSVKLVEDTNSNGAYDKGSDSDWGTCAYTSDNSSCWIRVSQTLSAESSSELMVIYEMGSSFNNGDTFKVTLEDIDATGANSGSQVSFANIPISSGVKTVAVPEAGDGGDSGEPLPPPPPADDAGEEEFPVEAGEEGVEEEPSGPAGEAPGDEEEEPEEPGRLQIPGGRLGIIILVIVVGGIVLALLRKKE